MPEKKTTMLKVLKAKDKKGGDKKSWREVGVIFMRENGKGTMMLHMFDGDFVVVPADDKDAKDAE